MFSMYIFRSVSLFIKKSNSKISTNWINFYRWSTAIIVYVSIANFFLNDMWNIVSSTSARVFQVQWPMCEKTACQHCQYQVGNLNYFNLQNALSRTSTSLLFSPLGPVAIRPNLSANCLNNFAALLRLKAEQSCRLNSSWISHNCFEIALPLIWLNR